MAVTFVTNGGTSVTKLENVEELPTPLPTTTKANNIFVGWFYDSGFEVQAFSGDTISSNITLYAKWYANMSDFYQDVADEIRSKNGETNPIKHTDFAYKIKSIQVAKSEETKTVTPDFSSGNIEVTPTTDKVMTQVTINKDTTNHKAENIKDGVTLYGIEGSLTPAKAEETKTVTPNFSSGNVVVTPTSGKVMTQVTVNKDSNLIAGNIKKDITVHGITGSSFIAIELTQAQYDALPAYDNNTYYLIVEE